MSSAADSTDRAARRARRVPRNGHADQTPPPFTWHSGKHWGRVYTGITLRPDAAKPLLKASGRSRVRVETPKPSRHVQAEHSLYPQFQPLKARPRLCLRYGRF
jgi:hypothetical protein